MCKDVYYNLQSNCDRDIINDINDNTILLSIFYLFLSYRSGISAYYNNRKITMREKWNGDIFGIPREMCSPKADNGARITNETGHTFINCIVRGGHTRSHSN